MHIISQLRPGADLSRVVLPTFILEPRSMLERITKYVVPGQENRSKTRADKSAQLHVPPRNAPADPRYRRPRPEICLGSQVLPERLAHSTSVRRRRADILYTLPQLC